jgi:hypothetical protein
MRLLLILTTMLTVAASLAATPAYAQSCQQLWVERNQYFKNHGYCFKTQRAIKFFGNAGCRINNEGAVPLRGAHAGRPDPPAGTSNGMPCIGLMQPAVTFSSARSERRNARY